MAQEHPAPAHQEGHGHQAPDDAGAHHDFADVDRWVDAFDSPERAAWQKPDEVVRLMELVPGMAVADLGAGTGYFLPWLSPAVGPKGAVLALDPEPRLVAHMRQRVASEGLTNVEPRQIPYDDPGLGEDSVDRVLIVDTWHHIEEREAYSRLLRAALRPGGRVFVVDFTADSPHGPPVQHRLNAEEVAAELAAGGLVTRVIEEPLPWQWVVEARRDPTGEEDPSS